jgi:ParB family transcriptional regulator, chromosome partitioning protein
MSIRPIDQRLQRSTLRQIDPNDISPNPENPRLIFRQEEMDKLLQSIDRNGIQVPVTVYRDAGRYFLLDGERRWRCAKKLNLDAIPAIVQDKPTELQNLVLMYNIHALREQWDYFTIASKLERVIELHRRESGESPNERQLSEITGLSVGAIRRCQALIGLPSRFKLILVSELEKPKIKQRLTEDFFIEMERSLKAVVRRMPKYMPQIDRVRDTLVEKFVRKDIKAVTDFRQLSKIATAVEKLGLQQAKAERAIDRVFDARNSFGIKDAYTQTVEFQYIERKASREASSLRAFLEEVIEEDRIDELDDDLVAELEALKAQLNALLSRVD